MTTNSACLLAALTITSSLAGCAATYKEPAATPHASEATFAKSKAELFSSVRRALVADGNQILNADEASGTISTVARDYRLTPDLADCGTTMGIDYLKDNRTSSKLAYGILVDEGRVTVRALLQSEYKPGQVSQNITLTCVSRGALERAFLRTLPT